jgi:hypothetical protein
VPAGAILVVKIELPGMEPHWLSTTLNEPLKPGDTLFDHSGTLWTGSGQ